MRSVETAPTDAFRGSRVFLRADLNVPVENGRVADDYRLVKSLPTIKLLLERGAGVTVASHLGRPKGKPDPQYSLAPVAERLSALLGREVRFEPGFGARAEPGEALLLENLRFHKGEKTDEREFAKGLAALADLYVNDAFGTAHRAHASVHALPLQYPPDRRYAGLLMAAELSALRGVAEAPRRPFVALLGGAKVADKLPVLERLFKSADRVLVGGGMACTFLKARGDEVGGSLVDESSLPFCAEALEQWGDKLLLPVDHIAAETPEGQPQTVKTIPAGLSGYDVGPKTRELFAEALEGAGTLFWNGPLGLFERGAFAGGTKAFLAAAARATEAGCATVLGGGDTARALHDLGYRDERFSHVSTGGGAALALLAGETLPGVEALG